MSGHDPCCPWDEDELPGRQHCACDLIARVRADEREKIAQAIEAAATPITRPALELAARIAREGTP